MEVLEWLEATQIGILITESLYGFPIVVGIHIVGLIFSVGLLVWFDLRLMGLSMTHCPVSKLYRRLMPWALAGFTVMFISGAAIFIAYATLAYSNFYFRVKLLTIGLAGINALMYHRFTERKIADWNESPRPPLAVRLAGLFSIVFWTVVILSGRMMSYTMF